ncbi:MULTISPECIES: glycosyltransferase family 2 protein [unclassified Rathayibacter]|uniref:glycosyltransferase family 2 protein n=1 Tax=unclassified Rathayibacter TaxID=2609250 RepID=UPI000CE803B4|nr:MULTISPECIES: glycosyltransferase [unclassified Rathayibacter]PPF38909.1 glycosyl transferase [Rathayibacter sp. AY1A2]PPF58030.1 glycosyl transferase [Rathayibacter sp. AY1C2]PPH49942.1 glycosyl transferase [Rathayibacter sp. AY1E1]PPH84720.1 glycosyl transferase [Rathayibacter sp. AY1D5]PPI10443.1 glycosyl transferase [Rathayibacter sp. AY1D2]
MSAPEPRVGVVVLTQGTRPDDLAAGLAGVLAQEGVELDVVCVGNGWEPDGLPEGVRALALPENLGIPAGRNAGVDAVAGEYLFFLDDDARIPSPRFLVDAVALLASNRRIGLVQPRVDSTDGTPSPRRWIPRILKGDPRRSGPVFSVWEGAVVLRRDVFAWTGGWAAPFFYAHEGIELAWRVWDTGRTAWYAGELVAQHPVIQPTRHADYYRLNARNRVWLARRNLAAPLALVYVASWTAIQCLRWRRDPAALRAWFAGWREGWRSDPGGRRVLSARTVLRMAFAGRPPIV